MQMDPGYKGGTPSKSPIKSPIKSPPPSNSRDPASVQKRAEVLCLLEHATIILLSQATRYLVDSSVDPHSKQILKKELANELVSLLACVVTMAQTVNIKPMHCKN